MKMTMMMTMTGLARTLSTTLMNTYTCQHQRRARSCAVPLHVRVHLHTVEAAATKFARPHAVRVVVKFLHHLLLVHAKSVTIGNICSKAAGILPCVDDVPQRLHPVLVLLAHAVLSVRDNNGLKPFFLNRFFLKNQTKERVS